MRDLALPLPPATLAALRPLLLAVGLALLIAAPAQAQSNRYILGPGSKVGPATQIKPTNCVTAADGTITCDTQIVNPPSDTPAKPQYDPFDY